MQVVHGNPHQQPIERAKLAPYVPPHVPLPRQGISAGAPGTGAAMVDPVDLSPEARMIVENAVTAAPGNSAQSTAHRARAMMAEFSHAADMPFGKVVSGLANGSLELTPPAAVPPSEDGQEIAAPSDEGDGAEPPADPANPVEIVSDDPVAEGGQTEPAEETVTDGAAATIDEAPGESTATMDEAQGDPAIDVDLVALFDTGEEIVEIVAAAAADTPLNEMTQGP